MLDFTVIAQILDMPVHALVQCVLSSLVLVAQYVQDIKVVLGVQRRLNV